MVPDIVLASTSPYRKALISRLGIGFQCVAPEFEEAPWEKSSVSASALAQTLALGKALSVQSKFPTSVIIGSDQIVALDGKVFAKPGNEKNAVDQLMVLSGKIHELHCAVAIVYQGKSQVHLETARMQMASFKREAFHRYAMYDKPWDCAGSYKIESLGISLFDRAESNDPAAIEGLPLVGLCRLLREIGIAVP